MPVPFVVTASYPARDGNAIVPLIDGEPAFRRVCEAIDGARESVWVTVAFMWASFTMPDGRGSALDVLETAASRGIDVRVVFWRPDSATEAFRENAFWGSDTHFAMLAERYRNVNIRWDRAEQGFCQHQKTWLVDANRDDAIAFVGGINLNPHSVVSRAHVGEGQNHDVYVEIAGPAVADVHHNFVQRWNEATERREATGRWGPASDAELPFPARLPSPRGAAVVQIQRTGATERTILQQYRSAIGSARRTIYLENQYLSVVEIIESLELALSRGVDVVAMMPLAPELPARPTSDQVAVMRARACLARFENFTLCGMAGRTTTGVRTPVYVHSKLMIVDDEWATVGSCNLHRYSLFGNSELNASFVDSTTVRALRVTLFDEHLGMDTAPSSDVEALRLFRTIALENRKRRDRGETDWQGMAFALDPPPSG